MLTSDQIAERFRQVTGCDLVIDRFSPDLVGVFSPFDHLTPSPLAHGEYGNFLISVYEPGPPFPLHPEIFAGYDAESEITWLIGWSDFSPVGPSFSAQKEYGANIRVRWHPPSGKRETSEQWDRLDAALTAVVALAP